MLSHECTWQQRPGDNPAEVEGDDVCGSIFWESGSHLQGLPRASPEATSTKRRPEPSVRGRSCVKGCSYGGKRIYHSPARPPSLLPTGCGRPEAEATMGRSRGACFCVTSPRHSPRLLGASGKGTNEHKCLARQPSRSRKYLGDFPRKENEVVG